MIRFRYRLSIALVIVCATLATAGTQVKGSIVPHDASAHPQVSAKSKFKLKGTGEIKVSLKGMTDAAGAPAPITTGATPDTQYWVAMKIDVQGNTGAYNVPFNVETVGAAKVAATVGLISLAPGVAVGIQGVEIHEPVPAADVTAVADCTALMNDPMLPGVWILGVSPTATNPCASGARLGLTGIVAGQ